MKENFSNTKTSGEEGGGMTSKRILVHELPRLFAQGRAAPTLPIEDFM
jgi:hypothetical protein